MKLTRIELINYRCFEHVELDLTQPGSQRPLQVALLVGPNGAGKSAILDALCGFFTFLLPLYRGDPLGARDVRLGAGEASVRVCFEDRIGPAENSHVAAFDPTVQVLARTTATNGTTRAPGPYLVGPAEASALQAEWLPWVVAPEPRTTGLIVMLEAQRILPPVPIQGPNVELALAHRCTGALNPTVGRETFAARFGYLKQWLVNVDYQRLRSKVEGRGDLPTWDLLRDGLSQILHPWKLERISERMDVLFSSPDGLVPLEALSAGSRSLFVILAELVMRLSLTVEDPSQALLQDGVCLIDELDAHLHPQWQERVLPALRRLFPNVQFVVTTHSPFVVGSALANEIFQVFPEGFG